MDDYPAGDPMPNIHLDYNNNDTQQEHAEQQAHAYTREFMEFLQNSNEMRQTARSSMKQAAYAGGGALAGGVLLGPPGGLVGGIVGSIVGYVKADNYNGCLLAISKLEEPEKKILMKRVGQVLMAAGATAQQMQSPTAFSQALMTLAAQPSVRDDLWNVCAQALQT